MSQSDFSVKMKGKTNTGSQMDKTFAQKETHTIL